MADNISAALHLECVERIEAISSHMAQGGCKDYGDYKEQCGKVVAYMRLMEFIEDAEKAAEEGEDRGG